MSGKIMSPNFRYIPSRCYTIKLKLWNSPTKIIVCANKLEPKIEWISLKSINEDIDLFQIRDKEMTKNVYDMFGVKYDDFKSSRLDISMQFTGKIVNPLSKLAFNESITYNCYKPAKDVIIRNKTTHYGIWNDEYETLLLIVERQMYKDGKKVAKSVASLISKRDTLIDLLNVV